MNDILLNLPEGKYMKLLISFSFLNNQSNQRTHPIEKQHRTNYAQQQSQSHHTYLCPCNSLNRHVVSHCQHHTSAYSSQSIDNRWHLLFGAVRWLG